MCSKVEAVGTLRLVLKSGLILDLENIFYVLLFSRLLISVFRLCNVGHGFLFDGNILVF